MQAKCTSGATGFVWLSINLYRKGYGGFIARLMTLNTDAQFAKNRLILGWKGALEVIRPNALLEPDSTVQLDPTSSLLQLRSVTQRGLVQDNNRNEPSALVSIWKVRKRAAVHSLTLNLEQHSRAQIWADSCHITSKGICCRKSWYANMQGMQQTEVKG